MCLLITQPAGTTFDYNFLSGVYSKNKDGIGVMYAENGKVHVTKHLPKTDAEALDFYNQHINGKECAVHYRMQTHGDIDLLNCHPYQVISADEGHEMWLMHNGILHTDNHKDKSKSDTWHYIEDFLRPMLLKNPEFFMTEAFKTIIGEHIGSGNKFVLLDYLGNMVTINDDQGVDYNGAWLSNTYAWNAIGQPYKSRRVYPTYTAPAYTSTYTRSSVWDDDYYDWYKEPVGKVSTPKTAKRPTSTWYKPMDDWTDALFDYLDANFMPDTVDLFSWKLAEDYYKAVGHENANLLLDALEDYAVDAVELYNILESLTPVVDLIPAEED
jgi:hypothetical protein